MATKVISTTQIEQIGAGIAAQISEQLKGLSLESHLKELNDGQAAITTEVSRLADKVAVQNGSVARTIKEVGDLGLRVSKLESDRVALLHHQPAAGRWMLAPLVELSELSGG